MGTTSKEITAKIKQKKLEITTTQELYRNRIEALNGRELKLDYKTSLRDMTMLNSTKKAKAEMTELVEVRNEILNLKKERDEKINKLKNELSSLKEDYRKNYERYKKEDKQAKKKAKEDKITDLKIYFDSHKTSVIFSAIGICLVIVLIIVVFKNALGVACPKDFIGLTVNEATDLAEKKGLKSDVWGSTYDPDARDEQVVDFVSAIYNSDGAMIYGYNKYMDTDRRLMSGQKISFEVTNQSSKQKQDIADCMDSDGNPDYKFESGKVVCYQKETEEEKKAKCESEGKWYRDGQCKSQEEWELHYQWQDAHAACKKYGVNAYAKTLTDCYVGSDYKGPVSGSSANNNQTNDSQETESADNGEELPDDISPYDIKSLCERGFETIGYPNAEIKMTNQYSMGYPPYIYVVVGSLSTKSSIISSRQQVGTIQCQANWQTWSIKSLFINGEQVY